MDKISPLAEISPPPCRGRVREGVETPFHHPSTSIPTFPLAGGRGWYALVFLLCAVTAHAEPFPKGNAEAGKKFFAQNNCNRCHDGIMYGDGNKIFTRPNRKVNNPQQMIAQFGMCSKAAGITITPQDEQDLGAYLSREYYHFK